MSIIPGRDIEQILKNLKIEKNIPFISTTVENNIIFDYVSKSYEELKEFLDKLHIDFSKKIDNYKILNVLKLEKLEDSI